MTKKDIINKIKDVKTKYYDVLLDNINNELFFDCLNNGYKKRLTKMQLTAYHNELVTLLKYYI